MSNTSSEAETQMRNNDDDGDKPLPNRPRQDKAEEDIKPWGILIFGLMGATVTTFAFARSQIPLAIGVVLIGALHYFLTKLVLSSQSAQIVKQGFLSSLLSLPLGYADGLIRLVVIRAQNVLAGTNFAPAKSFQPNEDQWLTSSNSRGLPEDLVIDQILSRLPVKSLMRFKSVCKRWHALPTDPSFIGSHLKHINTPSRLVSWNGNYNGLLFKHDGFQVFTVDYLPHGFHPVNLNFGFDRVPDIVLGPCEGIFCLYWTPTGCGVDAKPCVERLPTLLLWNPATRAFSILPKSIFDFPPYKKVEKCMVGFGFDRTTKSIKAVKVVSFCRDEYTPDEYINCAEVYELGSGSWRVLCVDDILQEIDDYNGFSMYDANDGVFHWCSALSVRDPSRRYLVELVLSFDMSSELFHMTLMPEKYNNAYSTLKFSWKACYILLLRDSIAVSFSYRKNDGSCRTVVELWVMKKDFDCVFEAGKRFSYSWSHESTEELTDEIWCHCSPLLMGFLSKNELLLQTLCILRTPILYDIVTKQAWDLQLSGEPNFLYRESLLSPMGGCGSDFITYPRFGHK